MICPCGNEFESHINRHGVPENLCPVCRRESYLATLNVEDMTNSVGEEATLAELELIIDSSDIEDIK